jgi:chemotaxis protein MotB
MCAVRGSMTFLRVYRISLMGHGIVAGCMTLGLAAFFLGGCDTMQCARRTHELERELTRARNQLDSNAQVANQKVSGLAQAKDSLEQALRRELDAYKAKLEMTERGLVITFLSEVFFASGKDILMADGKRSLEKIASVLRKEAANALIAVEGHTDNVPIKESGWKSNWELAIARALSVVHYLIDECAVRASNISARSYGEFHPVASNATPQGRQQNRRVEIVIVPPQVPSTK